MKANLFKILSVMLVACLCVNFVSCKKDKDEPESAQTNSIVGLWRLYPYQNGQRVASESYLRINDDYTAELLGNAGTDAKPIYLFATGTYTSQNGWVVITYTSRSYFSINNNIVRCDAEFKELEEYKRYTNIYVNSNSGTEIEADLNDMKFCLVKSSMPSYWRSEFSEYPVTPSNMGMTSQWDLVSRYVLNGESYQSWWYDTPDQAGITFAANGEMGKCDFWASEVWKIENTAGRVGNNDAVSINSANCTWALAGKTLTMTCSSYDKITYNASGTEISRQKVTLSTPIERAYYVYTQSASWLTLYSTVTLSYYSFLRHSTAPSSAPAAAHSGSATFAPVRRNTASELIGSIIK